MLYMIKAKMIADDQFRRGDPVAGISSFVYRSKFAAERARRRFQLVPDSCCVYGVLADWDNDTRKGPAPEDGVRILIHARPLVRLPEKTRWEKPAPETQTRLF